jgi:hypothetical protein
MIANTLRRLRTLIATSPRWLLTVRMPEASLSLTIAVAICMLVGASLPTVFTLASGALVSTVPGVVEQGIDSPAGEWAILALLVLGLVFLVQQTVSWLTIALA